MSFPPPPVARRSAAVPSPCVSVCRMDPDTGWCMGCLRTIEEIAAWGSMGDARRLAVLAELPARRERAEPSGQSGAASRSATPGPLEPRVPR